MAASAEIRVRLQPRARVAPSRVRVIRRATSRDKVVAVEGVDRAALLAAMRADG